jgi:hypothetical protein
LDGDQLHLISASSLRPKQGRRLARRQAACGTWSKKPVIDWSCRSGDTENDVIYGGTGGDAINGGLNDDTLYGNDGRDFIYGSNHEDLIFGHEGDDVLDGGTGLDRLFGGVGNDVLFGRSHADTLNGGSGNDTFTFTRFESGDPMDTITDFGAGDSIELVFLEVSGGIGTSLVTFNNGAQLFASNGHLWANADFTWSDRGRQHQDECGRPHQDVDAICSAATKTFPVGCACRQPARSPLGLRRV